MTEGDCLYRHMPICWIVPTAAYNTSKELLISQKLQKNTAAKRRNLVGEAEPSTEEVKIKTGTVPEPPVQFDDVVSPTSNKGVYYQFSIETFGWYNIDILLKNVTGNVESELIVRISGSYREQLDIFLVIPEQKIYTKAGKRKAVLMNTYLPIPAVRYFCHKMQKPIYWS